MADWREREDVDDPGDPAFVALEDFGRRMHDYGGGLRELLDELRRLHDAVDVDCPARNEGLRCCVDHLLDGPIGRRVQVPS